MHTGSTPLSRLGPRWALYLVAVAICLACVIVIVGLGAALVDGGVMSVADRHVTAPFRWSQPTA